MSAEGIVYLVGAGPGDPDLITLKGLEVLKKADVIVYDRLINKRLLQRAPVLCELIEAGKTPGGPRTPQRRINQILVDRAHQGKRVVRLKGGDPFVFGRGGEELLYCREAGVRCEVVPGVTSALAGPASLQIPVTHRELAHNLAIVSGHSGELDYATLAGPRHRDHPDGPVPTGARVPESGRSGKAARHPGCRRAVGNHGETAVCRSRSRLPCRTGREESVECANRCHDRSGRRPG